MDIILAHQSEPDTLNRYCKIIHQLDDECMFDLKEKMIEEIISKLNFDKKKWDRRRFNEYYRRYITNYDTPLIPIPRINAMHIDKMISTRGKIISMNGSIIVLQETSKRIEELNITPFQIQVEINFSNQIKNDGIVENDYVCVKGTPIYACHKGTKVNLIHIRACGVFKITEEEANLDDNHLVDTFFTEENLANLKTSSSEELYSILITHANEEGFHLVRTRKEETRVQLLCYLHSKHNKKIELNTNCNFFINLTKIKAPDGTGFIWHVATHDLNHNHSNDPFTFAHKTLTKTEKKFILSMLRNGVSNITIAKIVSENSSKILSSSQISLLSKEEKRLRKQNRMAETEELRLRMLETNGYFYYDDSNDTPEKIKRKVFASFTIQEYSNLERYGDFVSIDPTFYSMSSNWSIIPLTVIGCEREVRSAGLIFASSLKSETFYWILHLLVDILPSKDKLTTICSDDDTGLNGAFTETKLNMFKPDTDNKILKLKRVICCWHKIQNFIKFISIPKLPEDDQQKFINLFKIMGMTRDKKLSEQCYAKLSQNELIRNYLEMNIGKKINMIAKSSINYFTCGYNTSSVSESINSRLKNSLPLRYLTLTEIRDHYTFVENNAMLNNRYYKIRKIHKIVPDQIKEIMSRFNVSEAIAEAILGSIIKSDLLEIELSNESAKVKEKKSDVYTKEDYFEEYIIVDDHCSCNKEESAGIPCSHYIRYLKEIGKNILESIRIAPRWQFDYVHCLRKEDIEINTNIPYNPPVIATTNEKDRFTLLRSRLTAIASLAAKDQSSYEIVNKAFDNVEKQLDSIGKEPEVEDCFSARPGRHKGNTKTTELCCAICSKAHSTEKCPHREEVRKCAPIDSQRYGNRHCSICLYSGHNAAKCPALASWKAAKEKEKSIAIDID